MPICKSDFCVVCEHFMGFVDCHPICEFDDNPCKKFVYNGSPKPDAPKGCRPTELLNEYLLNLGKKCNDRNY